MVQRGYDPTDRDAFLMLPDAVTLLRDLRPEDGIGEGMDYIVALAHHAYLAWNAGSLTLSLTPDETKDMLGERIHTFVGSDELLELGWRTLIPAHAAWPEAA